MSLHLAVFNSDTETERRRIVAAVEAESADEALQKLKLLAAKVGKRIKASDVFLEEAVQLDKIPAGGFAGFLQEIPIAPDESNNSIESFQARVIGQGLFWRNKPDGLPAECNHWTEEPIWTKR